MADFLARKHFLSLKPEDEAGEQQLQRVKQHALVLVTMRQPRNLQHHKLFWALMTKVWEQLEREKFPTVETLVHDVKIVTGHYSRRDILFGGKTYPVLTPESISFARMDQTDFASFFDRVCDYVAEDILPGVSQEELKQELEYMTGMRIDS